MDSAVELASTFAAVTAGWDPPSPGGFGAPSTRRYQR